MEKRILNLENKVNKLDKKYDGLLTSHSELESRVEIYHKRLGEVEKTTTNTNKKICEVKDALLGTLDKKGFITKHTEMYEEFQKKKSSAIWWDRLVVGSIASIIVGVMILILTKWPI